MFKYLFYFRNICEILIIIFINNKLADMKIPNLFTLSDFISTRKDKSNKNPLIYVLKVLNQVYRVFLSIYCIFLINNFFNNI